MLSQCRFSTSPSIYVNFRGLNAGDYCGTTYIQSTMIAFSLGELSTVAGPIGRFLSSQRFDPADLPCPPRSIMVRQPLENVDMIFSNLVTTSLRIGTHPYQAYHIGPFLFSPTRSDTKYRFSSTATHFGSAYLTPQEP